MTKGPVSGVLAVVRPGNAATSGLGIGRDPDVLGGEAAYQEHGLQGDLGCPCLLGGSTGSSKLGARFSWRRPPLDALPSVRGK